MRIAYLVPGLGISGGINVILEHANFLSERGNEVLIVNIHSEHEVTWRRNGCPVTRLSDLHTVDMLFAKPLDVLILTGWQTVYIARRAGLTARHFVYFVQADESQFYPSESAESMLAMASYGLQLSYMTEARWIREWLRGFGHDAVYVPNGLDFEVFKPQAPILPKSDRLRVLIEGPLALNRKKVREAFAAVRDLDIELWCVSSAGQLEPWMRPDMFFEAVPLAQMPAIYASCDVLVKLSMVEGFFGPPLEMMACGGTAVTSDVTGHDEYMEHGRNGFVVPGGDVGLARTYIEQLIADRPLLKRLQAAGLQTAARFGWDASLPAMETWLRELVGREPTDTQSSWFRSPAEQAAFDVCTQTVATILPHFATSHTVQTLPDGFAPGSLLQVELDGWAWPAVPIGIELTGAKVLDCQITRHRRPDVEAVIDSPPGVHSGFRINALLELEAAGLEPDLSKVAVRYRDGSVVTCRDMDPSQNCTDHIRVWVSWIYSVRARCEVEPDFQFRLLLSKGGTQLRLLDRQRAATLANLHNLRPDHAASGASHTVFATDNLLLYAAVERPENACILLTPRGSRPTSLLAVRSLAV